MLIGFEPGRSTFSHVASGHTCVCSATRVPLKANQNGGKDYWKLSFRYGLADCEPDEPEFQFSPPFFDRHQLGRSVVNAGMILAYLIIRQI